MKQYGDFGQYLANMLHSATKSGEIYAVINQYVLFAGLPLAVGIMDLYLTNLFRLTVGVPDVHCKKGSHFPGQGEFGK
jgi:hypothetical protein